MLLGVLIEALEALNEVLLLVVWQLLHHVDHQDSIATVTETRRQVQSLVLRVVYNLGLCPSVDVFVQEDAFFEEHIHLVILIIAPLRPRLLVDVQVEHLLKVANIDLVSLKGLLGQLLRQQISIRGHETVDYDLVALHIDASKHTVVRDTHNYHLILVVASTFLLEADALGCQLGLGVIRNLVLILATPVPACPTVQARNWVLLVYNTVQYSQSKLNKIIRSVRKVIQSIMQKVLLPSAITTKAQDR